MTTNGKVFAANDMLRTLVEENRSVLTALSRFGISFGFGDKTVAEVCNTDGVDCDTFLTVCNFLCGNQYDTTKVDLRSLMNYLRRAHTFFLDFLLPSIRRKLIEAINRTEINDVAMLLIKFFDDYMLEVRKHMSHENDEVFSYVDRLLQGDIVENFRIRDYSHNHGSMTEKLSALKDIFVRHYHVKDNEVLTSALLDIIYCGNELDHHCSIENILFVPAVERLEKSLKLQAREKTPEPTEDDSTDSQLALMTSREKEIICCVAKGMSNKEIADQLCLSVHTVTTHRRNISNKLQIHSAAGITVFAILHKLIAVEDVDL